MVITVLYELKNLAKSSQVNWFSIMLTSLASWLKDCFIYDSVFEITNVISDKIEINENSWETQGGQSLFTRPGVWLPVCKNAGKFSRHYLTREACSDAIYPNLTTSFCAVIGWCKEREQSAFETDRNKIILSHDVMFPLCGLNMVEVHFLGKFLKPKW